MRVCLFVCLFVCGRVGGHVCLGRVGCGRVGGHVCLGRVGWCACMLIGPWLINSSFTWDDHWRKTPKTMIFPTWEKLPVVKTGGPKWNIDQPLKTGGPKWNIDQPPYVPCSKDFLGLTGMVIHLVVRILDNHSNLFLFFSGTMTIGQTETWPWVKTPENGWCTYPKMVPLVFTHSHFSGTMTIGRTEMSLWLKNPVPKMACPGKWKHGNHNLRFAPPVSC